MALVPDSRSLIPDLRSVICPRRDGSHHASPVLGRPAPSAQRLANAADWILRRSPHGSALSRSRALVGLAILAGLILVAACGREPLPALKCDSSRLQIQNQTERTWSEVEIWLNDHYRVQIPSLAPKQLAVVPLDVFVAGYGQRFNPKKQVVYGIEVSVRDGAARVPVLVWGKGKKKY
jgi:hypothetical protein